MDYETSYILKRTQIREIALLFRQMFNVKTIRFPVMKVLDLLEKKFSNNLYYFIDYDYNFENRVMAALETEDMEHFQIRIRESVYANALNGDRACIGYICHEMCHFFLIYICQIGPKEIYNFDEISFSRSMGRNIPPYKSMEWQAKALCGEVMILYDKCKNYSLKRIIYITKSSTEQAKYFLNHIATGDEEQDE